MKNKGFTLIELLGGILILTVIALITIPVISGVINKARLNSLKDSAYGLIDASNLYYAQFGVSSNTRFDKSDNENTLKELRYKGNVKEGTVIINTKGKVVVCITDGKNSAYKNYNESSVTLVSSKRCSVPENTNIVYLDNEATLTELSNQDIIDRFDAMETRIGTLEKENKKIKSENQELKETVNTLSSYALKTELSQMNTSLSSSISSNASRITSLTNELSVKNSNYTSASGTVDAVYGNYVKITSLTVPSTGTYLIMSFVESNRNADSLIANILVTGVNDNGVCYSTRGTMEMGGGVVNVCIQTLTKDTIINLKSYGYLNSSYKLSGNIRIIRLY